MKFTCDSCNAQYMISDEKVGPTGVKVRCKKCGHVITVRRSDAGAEESAAAGAAAAPTSGEGLDAELGSAFDSAFGDKPPAPEPEAD
ncbi:MAG: zinc-ribbon domain-containing protein, partial [Anaeromyxobacteraceae bacterium]